MPKFVMVTSRKPSVDVKGKNKISTYYQKNLICINIHVLSNHYTTNTYILCVAKKTRSFDL